MTIDFDELLNLWSQYKELKAPPAEAVRLWSDGGCGIWISDSWGPAVPYPSVDHGDGTRNFGYRRLKGNTSVVIPEAQEWPELQAFLKKVNAESSPIESVGCEASFFEGTEGSPPVRLGSYIDIIFTDAPLNDDPKSLLLLAHTFAKAVEDCDRWWANVSFALQRNRALTGSEMPWGLMLHITNYGRTQEEARRLWGEMLSRLSSGIVALPRGFRFLRRIEADGSR